MVKLVGFAPTHPEGTSFTDWHSSLTLSQLHIGELGGI